MSRTDRPAPLTETLYLRSLTSKGTSRFMYVGSFHWMQVQGQRVVPLTNSMEDTGPNPEQSEIESSNKSRQGVKMSVSWFIKHSYKQHAAT